MLMKGKEELKTSDFYLTVTLLALKEELLRIEKSYDQKRAFFIFKKSPTLDKHIEDFRRGKVLVEPQTLFMQHKSLKSRLYNNY